MLNDFKAFILHEAMCSILLLAYYGRRVRKNRDHFYRRNHHAVCRACYGRHWILRANFIDLSGKLAAADEQTSRSIASSQKWSLPRVRYGQLISDIVTFLIVGFCHVYDRKGGDELFC